MPRASIVSCRKNQTRNKEKERYKKMLLKNLNFYLFFFCKMVEEIGNKKHFKLICDCNIIRWNAFFFGLFWLYMRLVFSIDDSSMNDRRACWPHWRFWWHLPPNRTVYYSNALSKNNPQCLFFFPRSKPLFKKECHFFFGFVSYIHLLSVKK